MEIREQDFVDPPWDSKLDVATALRRIPETATVAGLFLAALADEAKRRGAPLASARDRYLSFQFYPLREHANLLLESCALLHPKRPLRTALRKLGHQCVPSVFASTIGKVMFASREDIRLVLEAQIKIYPVNLRPSHAELRSVEPGRAVVRLEQIHHFLDSHHVGIWEGALRFAGKRRTRVRIRPYSATSADFLCTWEA